jgi:hypothetical protein
MKEDVSSRPDSDDLVDGALRETVFVSSDLPLFAFWHELLEESS